MFNIKNKKTKEKKEKINIINKINFNNLTLKELKKIAKNEKIKKYYSMKKNELISSLKLIKNIDLSILSLVELKKLAENNKIKNYHQMEKEELIKAFNKLNKKNKLRYIIYFTFIGITIAVIITSFCNIFEWSHDNKKIEDLIDELEDKYTFEKIDKKGKLVNEPPNEKDDYWDYIKLPFYSVKFEELEKINKDTVAFIHLENTNINYPVVQTTDNEYYLNHAFDKSKNTGGWVFLDYRNELNPLDDNIVIYGHNRENKTMFSNLNNALTKEWQSNKDNYVIWLSTKKEDYIFQIFSIYSIKAETYYLNTDFYTKADKEKWIKTMKKRNIAPIDTVVSADDNILTLSTCKYNTPNTRVVIHAKLIKRLEK